MKKMKKSHKLALTAVAVLTIAGCTTAAAASTGWGGHHHNAQKPGYTNSYVTMDAAKAAALAKLGLTREEARFVAHECELDDGVYELELWAGGVEYDCRVDAATGAVLQAARDWDDDWDDDWEDRHDWGHHDKDDTHHGGGHHHDWDDDWDD